MTGRDAPAVPLADGITLNVQGAIIGLVVFILLWLGCFFLAFMIAFGNPSPQSTAILEILDLFFMIGNPLWGVPAALLLGAACIRKKE